MEQAVQEIWAHEWTRQHSYNEISYKNKQTQKIFLHVPEADEEAAKAAAVKESREKSLINIGFEVHGHNTERQSVENNW